MNNKDFITALATQTGRSAAETQRIVAEVVGVMTEMLEDGAQITVAGFGTFEVKKKMERIVVNPSTRQRMLVPPKLVVSFRSGSTLKGRVR